MSSMGSMCLMLCSILYGKPGFCTRPRTIPYIRFNYVCLSVSIYISRPMNASRIVDWFRRNMCISRS